MFLPRARLLALLLLAPAPDVGAERVLVVCPPAWHRAVEPWAELRRGQGHEVLLAARLPTPAEAANSTVILVGDGVAAGPAPARIPSLAVHRYGPETDIASDTALARQVGAGAVARWPFLDRAELARFVARVVRREASPPSDAELRVQIAAGVGGFSPLIDAAIEGAARSIVRDLAPADARLSLRRFPDNARPPQSATHLRGGVWVWLGHGDRDQLLGVPPADLAAATDGADAAVLVACLAGDFAAPGRCVAERMLTDADGPLAVIAATRVSTPYGNARLGGELLAALAADPRDAIGGLFARAAERTVGDASHPRLKGLDALATGFGVPAAELPEERRDHAAMYALLGDPLLVVNRQAGSSGPRVATGPDARNR